MSPAGPGALPPVPEGWGEAAAFLGEPARAASLDEPSFSELLARLRGHALSAYFVHRFRQADGLAGAGAAHATACTREEARAKASHAALMSGVERVLDCWEGKVARPYALKGLHVGAAYYPAPHLRPMADADLFFRDLGEGERAWALARGIGLQPQGVPLGRDPWLGVHELPMLQDPDTRFTLEVQGSLVFSTRDRRWLALAPLLDDPVDVEIQGHRLLGLRPEANLLYLLAHNFVQHAGVGPKLQPLVDVALLMERESGTMDWGRVAALAVSTGLASPTALGLGWARGFLGAPCPEGALDDLRKGRSAGVSAPVLRGPSQDRLSLEELCYQVSWRDRLGLLWARACPTREYMRQRYPEHSRRPLALLYPLRWVGQVARGVRALLGS